VITLPPYPGPSDLEREALAEEARQVALKHSPQARRNRMLLILIVTIGSGLFLCAMLVMLWFPLQ